LSINNKETYLYKPKLKTYYQHMADIIFVLIFYLFKFSARINYHK